MTDQGDRQLSFDHAASARRSPLLRRLDAVVAPVARDAGALVDDEEAIDMARAVCAAMAEADSGGLTRSQLLARAHGPWSAEALEARIDLFARLGLLQPYLAKAHQQRYVLNPAGMVGLLIVDRVAERGGVDELYVLLDRARTLLDSGTASRAAGRHGPVGRADRRAPQPRPRPPVRRHRPTQRPRQ